MFKTVLTTYKSSCNAPVGNTRDKCIKEDALQFNQTWFW
jgi:hypothetical protein